MSDLTLRLSVTVSYELNGTKPERLRARLEYAAWALAQDGLLSTADGEDAVRAWRCEVAEL
jgi:hypothetical protein